MREEKIWTFITFIILFPEEGDNISGRCSNIKNKEFDNSKSSPALFVSVFTTIVGNVMNARRNRYPVILNNQHCPASGSRCGYSGILMVCSRIETKMDFWIFAKKRNYAKFRFTEIFLFAKTLVFQTFSKTFSRKNWRIDTQKKEKIPFPETWDKWDSSLMKKIQFFCEKRK